MSEPTRTRGNRGEAIAARYLRSKGYAIVTKNYRDEHSRTEIDLIARHRDCLVFVEVKAGACERYGPPETWVDIRKQQRVMRAAAGYMQRHGLQDAACRFDVIGISFDHTPPQVTHIENAFWECV